MRFLIVGPGAMGCLFGARLKMVGFDVTLLDYNRERAKQINQEGISVEGVSGEYTAKVPVIVYEVGDGFDFALVCVKANKTRPAAEFLKTKLSSKTVIVTMQNGIGNLELLRQIFGKNRVLGGITAEGATALGWGKIRHAGLGTTVIGKGNGEGAAEKLASALNKAGFKADIVENVEGLLWGKLITNVGINALTAITRLKNGQLPGLEGTRLIMEGLVREAEAVAAAKRISLPYDDPLARVQEVCRNTSGNISSMLQDVLNKKETEIDFINGAIVLEGEMLGVPTPINSTLTHLVKAIEASYQERL